jgi:hypothetical protein
VKGVVNHINNLYRCIMENHDGKPLGKNLSDFCPKSPSKGPDFSPIARETQVKQHASVAGKIPTYATRPENKRFRSEG